MTESFIVKQTALEVQNLLIQLTGDNLLTTKEQQEPVAAEALAIMKAKPELKNALRVMSALKAGSVAAFEQLLNHPAASFLIAAVQNWQETADPNPTQGNDNQTYSQANEIIDNFNQKAASYGSTETARKACVIELDGNLADIFLNAEKGTKFCQALEILRQIDPTVKMRDLQEGSIKITLEGSGEGVSRILALVNSGELHEIAGYPVMNARELNEQEQVALKSHLIRSKANLRFANLSGADLRLVNLSGSDLKLAILNGANLSGADLSGSDLSLAILKKTNLSKADLSRVHLLFANLSEADLSESNLCEADLSGARLIRADLSGARLSGARLSEADLSEADLEQTIFSDNKGLSEEMKRDFIERGAIFQDSPGSGDRVLICS